MREIKFRGKRIDNGEWVHGCLLSNKNEAVISNYIAFGIGACWDCASPSDEFHLVDPSSVSQYTGLKDKNGVEIYEGDIVHYLYEPGKGFWNADQLCEIVFNGTGFAFGKTKQQNYGNMKGWLVSISHGNGMLFEVIGNIHDNPELLEGAI